MTTGEASRCRLPKYGGRRDRWRKKDGGGKQRVSQGADGGDACMPCASAGSSMAFLSGDLRAEGGNSRADVALPASKAGGERHLETIGAIAFEPALPVAPSPTGTNEDGQSADEEPSPKRQRTMGGQELLYEADLAVEDDPDATRALEERLAEYNRLKAKHKDNVCDGILPSCSPVCCLK